MNQPSAPRLPKWPFFAGDAVLLLAALALGVFQPSPLSTELLIAIVCCVGLAAILGVVPFWHDYANEQRAYDNALRARLEAESAKLHHSADVLAGAASNLKSAHESTARAMHTAEALPYRMQEKIGELTAQLQQLEDDDKAALEKEIEMLRETEGEKLAGVAEKVRAATKEFSAIEKELRPAIDAAVKQGRELEESLKSATSSARAVLLSAETKLKAAENHARAAFDSMEQNLQARLAELKQWEGSAAPVPPGPASAVTGSPRRTRTKPAVEPSAAEADAAPAPTAATESPAPAAAPMNGHHDSVPAVVAATSSVEAPVPEVKTVPMDSPAPDRAAIEPAAAPTTTVHAATPPMATDDTPVLESNSAPAAPVALADSDTAEPEVSQPRVSAPTTRRGERRAVGRLAAFPDASEPAVETSDDAPGAEAAPKREARRRTVIRSVDDVALPGFADHEIVYDDALNAGTPTAAKTSDGTTRLLVTAYIGIGNKVFLRGEGPGLSWEKGVPLEFVSIGKWSWQASENAGPIRAQLYKNDETKALGDTLVLEPGHHVEVRPIFREPNPF